MSINKELLKKSFEDLEETGRLIDNSFYESTGLESLKHKLIARRYNKLVKKMDALLQCLH